MRQPVTALYVHCPFCRSRCAYCDFITYAGLEHLMPRYVAALLAEADRLARRFSGPLATIYFGGGTPSLMPSTQIRQILTACGALFGLSGAGEITVEANPGTVTRPWLAEVRAGGVNRLSLGVQSMRAAELATLGRSHRVEDVPIAVLDARAAGFDNLSLDLIFGLPGQRLADWRTTLQAALALAPEHLSLYALTLEAGTPLAARILCGELPAPDPDLTADMFELADDMLACNGYGQYEISNWCRPGFECAHNLTYWRYRPYLGIGAGAHSFDGSRRWWNVSAVAGYVDRLGTDAVIPAQAGTSAWPSPAAEDGETLNHAVQMGEAMMLGLRLTHAGVSVAEFEDRFGVSIEAAYPAALRDLAAEGLITQSTGRLCLTPRGRLLGNRVFARFLPEPG